MNNSEAMKVKVLNKQFDVKCPIDEQANLLKASRYLNDKMEEIQKNGRVIGYDRIAIIAAINITYELLQFKEEYSDVNNGLNEHLQCLKDKIEKALDQQPITKNNTNKSPNKKKKIESSKVFL